MKKLGLYGGTFSPPHAGHVNAAAALLRGVDVDEVLIMPANIPPHKRISADDDPKMRLKMCRAAFGGMKHVKVSDFEIKKSGVSYTVDTLAHLRKKADEIYLLCGDDMFLTLDTWRRGDEILRTTSIVLMRREAEENAALAEKRAEYEEKYGTKIIFLDEASVPVSSTEVREKLAAGEDVSELVPEKVMRIIRKYRLYGV